MDYTDYSSIDFVQDPFFQRWVLDPDEESNLFWEVWLEKHSYKRDTIEDAIELIRVLGFTKDIEANIAFIEVWNRINAEREGITKTDSTKRFSTEQYFSKYQRIAAVFIGLLFLSFGIFFLTWDKRALNRYSTGFGETQNVVLPDSSIVTLNANSSVAYSPDWDNNRPREVWLEGEAYFDVIKHKQEVEFMVHTADLVVEVLGTKFNVNSRKNTTQVVLNSGKVKLKFENNFQEQALDMQPGDLVKYSSLTKGLLKKKVDAALYSSWREGKLEFNSASLSEIAALLEDNYGLQVVFQDSSIAGKKFTGMFPANDIDYMLSTLTKLYDLEVEKRENGIIILSAPTNKVKE